MIGDRLRIARNLLGMTLNELSEKYNSLFEVKISKGTLSKFETGKQYPSLRVINNLSQILDVSVDFLLEKTNYTSPLDNMQIKNTADVRQIRRERLLLLGEIRCGENTFGERVEDYIELGTSVSADFCLVVRGDGMINARIYDGDVVFVHKQNEVDNGDVAVVIIDGIATLKRVNYSEDSQSIILKSENEKYSPLIYSNEDIDKLQIIGKVVAFRSTVR